MMTSREKDLLTLTLLRSIDRALRSRKVNKARSFRFYILFYFLVRI